MNRGKLKKIRVIPPVLETEHNEQEKLKKYIKRFFPKLSFLLFKNNKKKTENKKITIQLEEDYKRKLYEYILSSEKQSTIAPIPLPFSGVKK